MFASDPFFDSLENLLHDLKAVTIVCCSDLSSLDALIDHVLRIITTRKLS